MRPPAVDFKKICIIKNLTDPAPGKADAALSLKQKLKRAKWLAMRSPKYHRQATQLLEGILKSSADASTQAQAKIQLARLLLRGQGVSRDEIRAVRILGEALPHSPVVAGMALGNYHFKRNQFHQAESYYRHAAAAGSSRAYIMLSRLYHEGDIPVPSSSAASEMLALAQNMLLREVANGHCGALRSMGMLFLAPDNGIRNEETAMLWLKAAAKAEDIPAMLQLATMYNNRAEKDEAQALWKRAAEAGNAEAMYQLGKTTGAQKWLQSAAALGHAPARSLLISRLLESDPAKATPWLQQAKEEGSATAEQLYQLAKLTSKETEALSLFRMAARAGSPEALVKLGDAYKYGKGVPLQPIKSYQYYRLAASEGSRDAMLALYENYSCGIARQADPELADRWLHYAMAEGAGWAMKQQISRLMGSPNEKDKKSAFLLLQRWVRQEALQQRKGNAQRMDSRDAMILLAVAYAQGVGVTRDLQQSQYWQKKAVAAGNGKAQGLVALAKAKLDPKELGLHTQEAVELLHQATALGSDEALKMLGRMYEKGVAGVKPDWAKAENYYRRAHAAAPLGALLLKLNHTQEGLQSLQQAAAGGEVEAMLALARYQAAKRKPEAIAWLKKAEKFPNCSADTKEDLERLSMQLLPQKTPEELKVSAAMGDTTAMRQLGKYYLFHDQPKQAMKWYEKAANAGDVQAMRELGNAYFIGAGIKISPEAAKKWWQLAAVKGDRQAAALLNIRTQN